MRDVGTAALADAHLREHQPATSLEYRPAIDGLRALAVLSVFIFHLDHRWLPGGFVGVDVFFVISGFLITSIIVKECATGSFSLIRFYQRRIARIVPAFFTVACATLLGASFIYSDLDLAMAGSNLCAAVLSVANLKFIFQGNYFAILPDAQPLLHYWSLSVEEQFYLFFPFCFLVLVKYAPRRKLTLLGATGLLSLIACIVLTRVQPVWAFYLLPTRAWELLAGCGLAVLVEGGGHRLRMDGLRWVSGAALTATVLSFLVLREGTHFPGYYSLLPVMGAAGLLLPVQRGVTVEKWLAAAPLVLIGRMSYSLYLWHWPIFSLVDYKLFLAHPATRLAIKITLSFVVAAVSFWFIERPARVFLNRRRNTRWAYIVLAAALIVCLPIGVWVRVTHFVGAEIRHVAKGGLVYGNPNGPRSILLMGDSNASMYGKILREACNEWGWKLTVISVPSADPLPISTGTHNRLWLDALGVVEKVKPDCVVLGCRWEEKLKLDKKRFALAVDQLRHHSGRVVVMNQPAILPANASRVAMRNGARPPFYEDPGVRHHREDINDYLRRFEAPNLEVIDVAAHFQNSAGEILYLDDQGKQLYQDSTHLSGLGAELIRAELLQAISRNDPKKVDRAEVQP